MSEDIEAISAAACMDVIARGEETINPKFAGVVRDLIDRLRLEASSSQARLSEAVKVLEPFGKLEMWSDGADDADIVIMTVGTIRKVRQFLATLGEENEA